MPCKQADLSYLRDRVAPTIEDADARRHLLMAVEELEAARPQALPRQLRILRARVKELWDARPAKAEELRACFLDLVEVGKDLVALCDEALSLAPRDAARDDLAARVDRKRKLLGL